MRDNSKIWENLSIDFLLKKIWSNGMLVQGKEVK